MATRNVRDLQKIAEFLKDKLKTFTRPADPTEKEPAEMTEQDIEINSDSEREALELFGNVVPAQKNAQNTTKTKQKAADPKPSKSSKEPQEKQAKGNNNLKSILRQPVRVEEEELSEQESKSSEEQEQVEVEEEKKDRGMEEQEAAGEKKKAVSFNFDDNLIFSLNPDRKWKDVIENEKKGKFELYEQKALSDAIGQYLAANGIPFDDFVRWLSVGSREEKHLLRREKFFKLLASVLPNRSPMSCYKFVTRNYNSLNHLGEWTPEETEKLRGLVEKYGRQWTRIGRELGRTSDNVYDKFRSLGEEGLEERVKGLWKLRELVELLVEIERQSGIEFLDHNVRKELESEGFHDGLEEKELKEHRYNSKLFTFHNIELLRGYVNAKLFQGIQLDALKWKKIVRKVPTRSHFDCRNKVVQILQVLFRNNESLDEGLVVFLEREKAMEEAKLDWRRWRSKLYSPEEAKNRFMIVKKLVEGRTVKPFQQVYKEVVAKLRKMLEKPKLP